MAHFKKTLIVIKSLFLISTGNYLMYYNLMIQPGVNS